MGAPTEVQGQQAPSDRIQNNASDSISNIDLKSLMSGSNSLFNEIRGAINSATNDTLPKLSIENSSSTSSSGHADRIQNSEKRHEGSGTPHLPEHSNESFKNGERDKSGQDSSKDAELKPNKIDGSKYHDSIHQGSRSPEAQQKPNRLDPPPIIICPRPPVEQSGKSQQHFKNNAEVTIPQGSSTKYK